MRKFLLLIACFTIVSGAAAQPFEFGVKAGLNLANLTDELKGKMKPSFYVGVFGEIQATEFTRFQPEIIYSRQGSFDKGTINGVATKVWIKYDYLNIPLIIKLNVYKNLCLEVGPQLGFLIDANIKVKAEGVSSEVGVASECVTFDFSVAMGLSYMFTRNIGVSARYNLGITGTAKMYGYYGNSDNYAKNRVLQIGMMYKF